MSRFSDIGFSRFRDVIYYAEVMNGVLNGKYGQPEVQSAGEGLSLQTYSLGEILCVFLIDDDEDEVVDYAVGHENQRLSTGTFAEYMDDAPDTAFFNLQVEVDGLPFWFACLNAPAYDLRWLAEGEEVQFSASSFAESVEVLSVDELDKSKYKGMAAESYIADFNDNPCRGFVSGIVKNFSLEQNPVTEENYCAVDADCLGVHFKMLIDPKLLEGKEIEVGKVVRGSFWNTALLK